MRAQPKASHFIDGAPVEDREGALIEVIYPATGEVISRVDEAAPAIAERALASAERAQRGWARLRPVERGRLLRRAHRVLAALQAGTCRINAYNLTPVEAPFGGARMSGVGRENSKAAVEHYTRLKSVHVGLGPVEAPY